MTCEHSKFSPDREDVRQVGPFIYVWTCTDCGLEIRRDLRPLAEIPFAMDVPEGDLRETLQSQVRTLLGTAGAKVGQDVLDAGCTGLAFALVTPLGAVPLGDVQCIRAGMAGSGLGLPCYVPPTRFCLVHNTIGGLQKNQLARHPEGVPLCSRDLTDVERAQVSAVAAVVKEEKGEDEEEEEEEATSAPSCPLPAPAAPSNFDESFRCPEHREPEWKCRYCLAAAIIYGPFEPDTTVVGWAPEGKQADVKIYGGGEVLTAILQSTVRERIDLLVRVARWERKLVKVE